jgi:hypothetical protein
MGVAFLESLKVEEVGALSNSWRGGHGVALLSETERIQIMQLVGANPGVEAWRSEQLLQKFREMATLTASKVSRNGNNDCFKSFEKRRR